MKKVSNEIVSEWNGFKRIDFLFRGREAILVLPEQGKENGKWLFKTEYFDAFPLFEIEMVKRGWTLAYIKNITRWCLDEDIDLKKEFAEYIIEKYQLNEKCVPVGMSCGGLIAVKFAAKYPECVAGLYLDAPVLNLLSCPADLGMAEGGMFPEFTKAIGMTMSELICYREHPIDKLPILAKNHIPIILVYGAQDTIVPYCENGAILEAYYRENNEKLTVVKKDNCEHHPHGLDNPEVIIEFVERL